MLSKIQREDGQVWRAPAGVTYKIDGSVKSFGTNPRYSYLNAIIWDGNGRDHPHYCTHHRQQLLQSGVATGTFNEYRIKATSSNPSSAYLDSVLAHNVEFACSGSTRKSYSVSDDEVRRRINDAVISLASSPIDRAMNLPRAILELKDTKQTCRSARKLFQYVRRYPKVGWIGATVAQVANAYLAWQFGIKPTIADVETFMGTIPKRFEVGVRKVHYAKGQPVRAGIRVIHPEQKALMAPWVCAYVDKKTVRVSPGVTNTYNAFTSGGFGSTTATEGSSSGHYVNSARWPYGAALSIAANEVSGCVFGRVANDFDADISALQSLQIAGDPLSTGWELTPFSFLVDWFVDLGQWIRNANRLNAARGLGFKLEDGIWLSKRLESVTYEPILGFSLSTDLTFSGNSFSYGTLITKTVKGYRRVATNVDYSRSVYQEVVRFPGLSTNGISGLDAFQWSTGTALAIQAASSIK